jgi:hypothetical protein
VGRLGADGGVLTVARRKKAEAVLTDWPGGFNSLRMAIVPRHS